jgi:hypothetical protein
MDTLELLQCLIFNSLPRENSGTALKNTNAGLSNPIHAPSTGIHVEVGNKRTLCIFLSHRRHSAQMDTFTRASNIDLEGYPGVRHTTSSAVSYSEDHKPIQVV